MFQSEVKKKANKWLDKVYWLYRRHGLAVIRWLWALERFLLRACSLSSILATGIDSEIAFSLSLSLSPSLSLPSLSLARALSFSFKTFSEFNHEASLFKSKVILHKELLISRTSVFSTHFLRSLEHKTSACGGIIRRRGLHRRVLLPRPSALREQPRELQTACSFCIYQVIINKSWINSELWKRTENSLLCIFYTYVQQCSREEHIPQCKWCLLPVWKKQFLPREVNMQLFERLGETPSNM